MFGLPQIVVLSKSLFIWWICLGVLTIWSWPDPMRVTPQQTNWVSLICSFNSRCIRQFSRTPSIAVLNIDMHNLGSDPMLADLVRVAPKTENWPTSGQAGKFMLKLWWYGHGRGSMPSMCTSWSHLTPDLSAENIVLSIPNMVYLPDSSFMLECFWSGCCR